jgi:hypothetical protein
LIAFHVFAVFIAPFASPPPASELAQATARLLRPYLKAVAIDNGYRFFAPNPVPSHLVRYIIEMSDGTTVEGRFPDWQVHWPRLMYHRQFMLAESLFNLAVPVAEIPVGGFANEAQREQFDFERGRADALRYSVAGFLLRQYPQAVRVQLFSVEHQIPTPWDLQDGLKLDDPRLYLETSLGVFTREDIERYQHSVSLELDRERLPSP